MANKDSTLFTKNFIFGVEDSLVSTVGLLSGVAAAGVDKSTILLTGVILIFVEAFSMGVGSYLSEQSAQEFAHGDGVEKSGNVTGALVMFFSYFASGFIPLFPYIVFDVSVAFWLSILLSLLALFLLGAVSAKYFKHKDVARHGMQMLVIGGIAVIAGVVVGKLINS